MITEAEYLHAQQIIDQYHLERQQQAEWDLDADDEYYHPDDDEDEFDEMDTRLNCKCGAWQIGPNGFVHVADCICGAE